MDVSILKLCYSVILLITVVKFYTMQLLSMMISDIKHESYINIIQFAI